MESFLNWEYMPLIPPLITLILVVITRRVGISLGAGIITSGFVIANGHFGEFFKLLFDSFLGIFIEDGGLNTWNAYILIFLTLLGIMTAFMNMSGGARAFTNWALTKVKTRRGAGFMTAVLGIIVFIDDYFSALIVGQVAKPITDKYNISRAKLAYFVDTTASPVAVMSPISSWGAGIMGMTAPVLIGAGMTHISPFQSFMYMIPMNFYVISAIVMMFIVISFKLDIGPMRKQENLAINEGILRDKVPEFAEQDEDLPVHDGAGASALIIPIAGLAVGVIGAMYVTGAMEAETWSLMPVLESTLVTHSLLTGGIIGLVLALFYYFRHTRNDNEFSKRHVWLGIKTGFLAMFPAMLILTFAWMIGGLISELGTGGVLGSMVENSSLSVALLPAVVFIVACFMALATGTSWGSYGILIPVAGEIIIALGATELLLPSIAAVLAGGVFGDHCSPISDSTILSSTGSGSDHIVHVMTQLPYALTSALIGLLGFVVLGYTANVYFGLLSVIIGLFAVYIIAKFIYRPVAKQNA